MFLADTASLKVPKQIAVGATARHLAPLGAQVGVPMLAGKFILGPKRARLQSLADKTAEQVIDGALERGNLLEHADPLLKAWADKAHSVEEGRGYLRELLKATKISEAFTTVRGKGSVNAVESPSVEALTDRLKSGGLRAILGWGKVKEKVTDQDTEAVARGIATSIKESVDSHERSKQALQSSINRYQGVVRFADPAARFSLASYDTVRAYRMLRDPEASRGKKALRAAAATVSWLPVVACLPNSPFGQFGIGQPLGIAASVGTTLLNTGVEYWK